MGNENNAQSLLPAVFVILGATGDLTRRKLVPALFHLYQKEHLPKLFQVVGFSKDELGILEFQALVQKILIEKGERNEIEEFSQLFTYEQGFFEEKEGYKKLAEFLGYKDNEWRVCSNKLFYIAAHPQHYKTIFQQLAKLGLTKPCSPTEGWTRVIVEKPFGKDLKTAEELDGLLGKLFREEQIYRVDHYLGKETVQNILAFRFSNSFLEPAWSKKCIESISIRFLERDGIGGRGAFYDGIGALRDVGQNHMLQLLALFLMENPGGFEGDKVRNARAEILRSLHIPSAKETAKDSIRAQYEGYRQENNVAPGSNTETYFRILAKLRHKKWKGVSIVLEAGKALTKDLVEVHVVFRHSAPCLCPKKSKHYKNVLHYTIEPKEKVTMKFWVKKPGPKMIIEEKDFSFDYREAFQGDEFAEAYERLLLNIIQGDQTLFVSTQEIMASWKFVDAVLRGWEKTKAPLYSYQKGASVIET